MLCFLNICRSQQKDMVRIDGNVILNSTYHYHDYHFISDSYPYPYTNPNPNPNAILFHWYREHSHQVRSGTKFHNSRAWSNDVWS